MSKIGRPVVMTADERRKEIFNAAEQLFGRHGFDNVTMTQIAETVGMSKKTLYVYFSDKRELLKSLITSSYIWPEQGFQHISDNPIQQLKHCMHIIADHVLSERHIQLCRLAIIEQLGVSGLANTFYEMGIRTSRNHLIECIQHIPENQKNIQLPCESLADMLFGASIAKPFIDLIFIHQTVDLHQVHNHIDLTIHHLFNAT